ncbi:MAG: VWA domain-containing protein [Bryobacteraceae bacterium]|nr:VWA domain-containing protein [Bryobacteraceae bacterium]
MANGGPVMVKRFGFVVVFSLSLLTAQFRKVGEPAPAEPPKPKEATKDAPKTTPEPPATGGWRRVGEPPRTPSRTPPATPGNTTPPAIDNAPPETLGDSVIFRTETREVNVTFSATGRNGGALTDLTQKDVEVYEDGARRNITAFSRDRDLPLTLGIVVDLSGSQRGLFRKNRREALAFLRQVLKPQDKVFIVTFGQGIRLVQDTTSSMRDIEESVGGWEDQFEGEIWSSRPGSPIYDSLDQIIRRKLSARDGRKALLVISDGEDTNSRADASDVTERLQTADTMVYWLKTENTMNQGMGGMRRGRGLGGIIFDKIDSSTKVRKMRKVALETGGRVFEDESLDAQFRRMEEELRTQYTLSFAPGRATADNGVHQLELRPVNTLTKLRHKPSYRDSQ